MSTTTFPRFSSDAAAPAPSTLSARAEFDASVERWLPRVYRFAETRLASRAAAEAATRRTLVAAARCGLLFAGDEGAGEVLRLAKAEVARVGRDGGASA